MEKYGLTEESAVEAVRMVRKAKNSTSRKTWTGKGISLTLALMGLFICELFVYTWCRVQYTHVGYDISQAIQEQDRLMAVQKKLQVELARLKSPERLAVYSERILNLKLPTSRQMVIIE